MGLRKDSKNEYKQELQEPQRHLGFDKGVSEVKVGAVPLRRHSRKNASPILPEDTTVYGLKQFVDAEPSKSFQRAQRRTLPAEALNPKQTMIEEINQWAKEGGRSCC